MVAPSSPARALDALPEDVLNVILDHFFSDPDPGQRRISVLLTCRALRDASLVHLYRVVYVGTPSDWVVLFGKDPASPGILTVESGRGLAPYVHELGLGARNEDGIWSPPQGLARYPFPWTLKHIGHYPTVPLPIGTVHLPNCSKIVIYPDLPWARLRYADLVHSLVIQLSPTILQFVPSSCGATDDERLKRLFLQQIDIRENDPDQDDATLQSHLGLPGAGWPSLQTVRFDGVYYSVGTPHLAIFNSFYRLGLSDWRIPTVVVASRNERRESPTDPLAVLERSAFAAHDLLEAFFHYHHWENEWQPYVVGRFGAYGGWGKVVFRLDAEVERVFQLAWKRFGERVQDEERKRLLNLMVLVGPDGEERRLIEEEEETQER
jgi:hypothetical protein